MKQKDMYTLEELYDNLKISLSKLSKIADVNEGTLIRIRKGQYSARRTTINKLLGAFSEIYGLELSLDNVTGIRIEDKRTPEKAERTYGQPKARQAKVLAEKASKRVYNRKQDTGLPEGCILASEFAESHGIARPTFIGHMNHGLGPGLIHGPDVPEDGSVQIKDWVRYEERNKRVRKDGTIETERYLTQEQQKAALDFWQRHDVPYQLPDGEE